MRQSISSQVPSLKLAIFAATRWECRSVQDAFTVDEARTIAGVRCMIGHRGQANIFLFQSGIGHQKAYATSQAVLRDEHWDLVISSGFAGALVPCVIGTIILGQNVMMDETASIVDFIGHTSVPCDESFRDKALQVASSIDGGSQSGNILCLPRVIVKSAEKKILAGRTHAVAIDMESGPLGHVAREQNIPFLVVRTISDLIDEDLPVDFNLFLHRDKWVKGISMIMKRPACLMEFLHLRKQMLKASRTLTLFFQKFFSEIGHDIRQQELLSPR